MDFLYDNIQETVAYLNNRTKDFKPQLGIVLGTGLGKLVEELDIVLEIPYQEIPHFPVSTVQGHAGKLVFGYLEGKSIVAMAGRFHYYEGYSMKEVTFPIRVLKFLGIKRLVISNATGSVNPAIEMGDLVFIRDHINLLPENPLRGANDERLGVRFPDLSKTYDKALNQIALDMATKHGVRASIGVYVSTQGPNLETPAEYQYFHRIGADVVGMSTVPEVLVAAHMNLPIFVVSVVSNKCYPLESIVETTLEDVINTVNKVEPKLTALIKELLSHL
ncbi:MAG: purine-nucleoside phosphorylase [Aureispira sp.]|nr:purine-nucleoside phosphorylase [Aureispira sp.]